MGIIQRRQARTDPVPAAVRLGSWPRVQSAEFIEQPSKGATCQRPSIHHLYHLATSSCYNFCITSYTKRNQMLHAIAPNIWHVQHNFITGGLNVSSRMTVVPERGPLVAAFACAAVGRGARPADRAGRGAVHRGAMQVPSPFCPGLPCALSERQIVRRPRPGGQTPISHHHAHADAGS